MKSGLLALLAIPIGCLGLYWLQRGSEGSLLLGLAALGLAYALIRDWNEGV